MKTNECSSCGAHNTLNAKKCWNCGYDFVYRDKMVTYFIVALVVMTIFVRCSNPDSPKTEIKTESTQTK